MSVLCKGREVYFVLEVCGSARPWKVSQPIIRQMMSLTPRTIFTPRDPETQIDPKYSQPQ